MSDSDDKKEDTEQHNPQVFVPAEERNPAAAAEERRNQAGLS